MQTTLPRRKRRGRGEEEERKRRGRGEEEEREEEPRGNEEEPRGGPGPKISLGGTVFFVTIAGAELVWGGGGAHTNQETTLRLESCVSSSSRELHFLLSLADDPLILGSEIHIGSFY